MGSDRCLGIDDLYRIQDFFSIVHRYLAELLGNLGHHFAGVFYDLGVLDGGVFRYRKDVVNFFKTIVSRVTKAQELIGFFR